MIRSSTIVFRLIHFGKKQKLNFLGKKNSSNLTYINVKLLKIDFKL